jgi:hypothetical protein
VFGRKLEADATQRNQQHARDSAERSAGAAASALDKLLAIFALKARGAAQNPAVQSLVRGGADEATVHDSLTTEEWSSEYREHSGSTALYAGTSKLGSSVTLLEDSVLTEMAGEAEANGEAQTLVPHQGLYLVAAARLPFNSADHRKVAVVLTRPLAQEEVDALASSPLLVTDGVVKLAERGEASALAALVGRESESYVPLGGQVAIAKPAGKVWVWTLERVTQEVEPLLPLSTVWTASALLSLGLLAMTLFATRRVPPRQQTISMTLPGAPAFAQQPSQSGRVPLATDATSPSHQLSRYIEVAPLGEGGMARISLAITHGAEGFRRQFVLKRLKTELTVNPEIVAQFIDEARLGASLVHSNVVPVFDFGRDDMGYFMAQEYILGRDLESVRRALFEAHRATLDVPLVLYVAHEALRALSYAHGKTDDHGRLMHLVHRDVSPNNLMISARGEVKLLDFGIVKAANKLSQTQTGMIKGNVFYMSPEQARGLEVDARSDLFSLGLVLFTACSGETLYRGTSNYDLLTRAAEGLSPAEWDRVQRLPPVLSKLLQRALQPDPKGRFQSAEEFSHAIPSGAGTASGMQQLMEALFKDDFARERARFTGAVGARA